MENILIFDYGENVTLLFSPFDGQNGLPFPMYLSTSSRSLLSFFMLFSLVYGLILRASIFSYLRSPNTRLGPIDRLIWMDQLSGLCFALVIVIRLIAINTSVHLSQIMGENFCYWVDWPSCMYLSGSVGWSAIIALYRFLLVKSQRWLTYTFGERNFFKIMLCAGFFFTLVLSILMAMFDSKNTTERLCFYHSVEDIEIILAYKVRKMLKINLILIT